MVLGRGASSGFCDGGIEEYVSKSRYILQYHLDTKRAGDFHGGVEVAEAEDARVGFVGVVEAVVGGGEAFGREAVHEGGADGGVGHEGGAIFVI